MQDIILKGTKICKCGHEFTLQDLGNLKNITDHGFYGGVVKHYSEAKCPHCNQETILLLKQKGQTWEILNTAIPVKNETTEIEENNNTDVDFICSICGKVCKSQLGLNSHMNTHKNN